MELIRYANGQGESLRLDRDEAEALEKALLQALQGYLGKGEAQIKDDSNIRQWEIAVEIEEWEATG